MIKILMPRRRDESGAVAIIVALMAVLLLMFAALAVDIGLQVNRKQQLQETLDAAAQAGAFELPGSAINARAEALEFAAAHDASETGTLAPNVDFWCLVASKLVSGSYQPQPWDIPATCYPGTGPYTNGANYKTTGRKVACSALLCAIPCVEPTPNATTPKVACNTIRVYQGRDVPFAFAPAGGIPRGSTGNLISVACKGSCGTVAPNPMDVAVVADRTQSMGATDIASMVAGIRSMLEQMTPAQQYVSLGTIGRSQPLTTGQTGTCNSSAKGLSWPSSSGAVGQWMPVSFSDNYLDASRNLNTNAPLVKGVDCLTNMSNALQGTVLAAPMKAASRYLLGLDSNNLSTMPLRNEPATKVLIFETDGQPNEHEPTAGSTSLTMPGDVFSHTMSLNPAGATTNQADTSNQSSNPSTITTTITHNKTVTYTYNGGANACQNLVDVATQAKAAGILVIMIGYNMTGKQCNDYDGFDDSYNDKTNYTASTTTTPGPETSTSTQCPAPNATKTCITNYQTRTVTKWVKAAASTPVLNTLASAASPAAGLPSVADSDCSTVDLRNAENSDGDYLFCGASGTDMAPIFRTALTQASKGIRLVRLP